MREASAAFPGHEGAGTIWLTLATNALTLERGEAVDGPRTEERDGSLMAADGLQREAVGDRLSPSAAPHRKASSLPVRDGREAVVLDVEADERCTVDQEHDLLTPGRSSVLWR